MESLARVRNPSDGARAAKVPRPMAATTASAINPRLDSLRSGTGCLYHGTGLGVVVLRPSGV